MYTSPSHVPFISIILGTLNTTHQPSKMRTRGIQSQVGIKMRDIALVTSHETTVKRAFLGLLCAHGRHTV